MTVSRNGFSIYSDEELMLLISNGKVEAFDELYYRYSGRLMSYYTRMLNFNRTLAEDALQDLFLKIATSPEKFDRQKSFKTWIFSVASNNCKNFYRHQTVVYEKHEEIKFSGEMMDNQLFIRTASKLDNQKFNFMLQEALNEMSPEKREAFILKYQEERTIAEIAAIQNCPEGSVKSRLHYALKILEKKLQIFNPYENHGNK
jgi:RNA polymerase sigma-70 factor, ECF subfamily